MRNFLYVTGAAFAVSALVSAASAEVLGTKFIEVDRFRYGGNLVVGADKNLDAVRVLIKAADSLGMMRLGDGARTNLVLGDSTNALRIDGNGTYNGQKAHVVMDWDYRYPGVRLQVETTPGKPGTIAVAADKVAWDEKTQGVYGGPAQTSAADRLVLAYLMPTAVILAGRDAADVMKLSRDERGRSVLTIPLPKLGANVNLVATLTSEGQPVRTQITLNGKSYTGEFDDYTNDRMDYLMKFPHTLSLKVDGKSLLDLSLDWHHVNPYTAAFPVPKEVAAK